MKKILIIVMLSAAAIFGTGCTDMFGLDNETSKAPAKTKAPTKTEVAEPEKVVNTNASAPETPAAPVVDVDALAKELIGKKLQEKETTPSEDANASVEDFGSTKVQDLIRVTEERAVTVAKIDSMLKELRALQQTLEQANENND